MNVLEDKRAGLVATLLRSGVALDQVVEAAKTIENYVFTAGTEHVLTITSTAGVVELKKPRMTKKGLRSHKSWTDEEREKAGRLLAEGLSYTVVGAALLRSKKAVNVQHSHGKLPGAPRYCPPANRQFAGQFGNAVKQEKKQSASAGSLT